MLLMVIFCERLANFRIFQFDNGCQNELDELAVPGNKGKVDTISFLEPRPLPGTSWRTWR